MKYFVVFLLLIIIGVVTSALPEAKTEHKTSYATSSVPQLISAGDEEPVVGTGGVSWVDYDNDGNLDYVIPAQRNGVYLFQGTVEGTFIDVTEAAGLPRSVGFVNASVFADYDNDSCTDLFLVSPMQDRLFKNTCEGSFADVTEEAGINVAINDEGMAAAWGDYNNDGFVDLYVAAYGDVPNTLYKNNGDGTFTDVTNELQVLGAANCAGVENETKVVKKNSFQPVWFDYDNDDDVDLYVSNDTHSYSPLYRNNGDGTFTDVTDKAQLCKKADAMGVAVGDYDNDLDLDLYITNTGPNLLWRNEGDGTFTDVATELGVDDPETLGWGTAFFDFDNDQDLDLYVVNGDVLRRAKQKKHIGDIREDRLFENHQNVFSDVAQEVGIQEGFASRGFAIADYNLDGYMDFLIGGDGLFPPYSYRLYTQSEGVNNWLTIQLTGTKSNRDAIGAVVYVTADEKTQMRQVLAGDSFFSQNDLTLHFGLGQQKVVDKVEVRWPSGEVTVIDNVAVNERLEVVEGV